MDTNDNYKFYLKTFPVISNTNMFEQNFCDGQTDRLTDITLTDAAGYIKTRAIPKNFKF